MTFDDALKIILKHEGGFVNHPRDPGGMTNLGVTKRVWEEWTGKPASEQEMRSLTPEKVAPLYKKRYWDKVKGDELPIGLALHVFDFGVNAGTSRAIKTLQRMVGTFPDGLLGPLTRRAVRKYVETNGAERAIRQYEGMRESYYRSLRIFDAFGRGWLRRNREVTKSAIEATL